MRSQFPLFNTPIDLAHQFWQNHLSFNDAVIDATCGNGKDSLFLANLLKPLNGILLCIDIQEKAIEKTKILLQNESHVFYYQQSHETLPDIAENHPLKLVVYNLGYLPSGDKSLTTQVESTLKSIESALNKIAPGGVISITCYPGHLEGKKEQDFLLEMLSKLDPLNWSFSTFFWPNRNASPSLFFVQKKSGI